MAPWTTMLPALFLLPGCTTVHITGPDGELRVERHFGLVSIELAPDTHAVVAEVDSLGYQSGPLGVSLGWGRGTYAALPADCTLVVWLERPEQAENLRQLLGDPKGLCVINPKDNIKEVKP